MSEPRILGITDGGGHVQCFGGGHYVVEMQGHFDATHLRQALQWIRGDSRGHAHSVLFAEGADFQSFDRSVLTFYERDPEPFEVDLIGVVTSSTLRRMVSRAAGLGLSAFTRTRFEVFPTLDVALSSVRSH